MYAVLLKMHCLSQFCAVFFFSKVVFVKEGIIVKNWVKRVIKIFFLDIKEE